LGVKPAATIAVITILAVLVIAEVIALVDTTNFPPAATETASPGIDDSLLFPPKGLASNRSLSPGLYDVRSPAIALKVPAPTGDKCVHRDLSPPPMPAKHPKLEVIPVTPAK
jgi:hypothetical protein